MPIRPVNRGTGFAVPGSKKDPTQVPRPPKKFSIPKDPLAIEPSVGEIAPQADEFVQQLEESIANLTAGNFETGYVDDAAAEIIRKQCWKLYAAEVFAQIKSNIQQKAAKEFRCWLATRFRRYMPQIEVHERDGKKILLYKEGDPLPDNQVGPLPKVASDYLRAHVKAAYDYEKKIMDLKERRLVTLNDYYLYWKFITKGQPFELDDGTVFKEVNFDYMPQFKNQFFEDDRRDNSEFNQLIRSNCDSEERQQQEKRQAENAEEQIRRGRPIPQPQKPTAEQQRTEETIVPGNQQEAKAEIISPQGPLEPKAEAPMEEEQPESDEPTEITVKEEEMPADMEVETAHEKKETKKDSDEQDKKKDDDDDEDEDEGTPPMFVDLTEAIEPTDEAKSAGRDTDHEHSARMKQAFEEGRKQGELAKLEEGEKAFAVEKQKHEAALQQKSEEIQRLQKEVEDFKRVEVNDVMQLKREIEDGNAKLKAMMEKERQAQEAFAHTNALLQRMEFERQQLFQALQQKEAFANAAAQSVEQVKSQAAAAMRAREIELMQSALEQQQEKEQAQSIAQQLFGELQALQEKFPQLSGQLQEAEQRLQQTQQKATAERKRLIEEFRKEHKKQRELEGKLENTRMAVREAIKRERQQKEVTEKTVQQARDIQEKVKLLRKNLTDRETQLEREVATRQEMGGQIKDLMGQLMAAHNQQVQELESEIKQAMKQNQEMMKTKDIDEAVKADLKSVNNSLRGQLNQLRKRTRVEVARAFEAGIRGAAEVFEEDIAALTEEKDREKLQAISEERQKAQDALQRKTAEAQAKEMMMASENQQFKEGVKQILTAVQRKQISDAQARKELQRAAAVASSRADRAEETLSRFTGMKTGRAVKSRRTVQGSTTSTKV